MLTCLRKSDGALVTATGADYYGQSRPADDVPVISRVPVAVRFFDDFGAPTLLDPASGTLTFTALPAAGDTFTVGQTTYTAVSALTGAANQVLLGANLAAFMANLTNAINGSSVVAQGPGVTYAASTVANTAATAAASGATVVFSAVGGATLALSTNVPGASYNGSVLSFTILPAPLHTFTVNGFVYSLVRALSGNANEVLVGATVPQLIANLVAAVNAATVYSQGPGVTYGTGTVVNAQASASPGVGNALSFNALAGGAAGNSVVTSETSSAASFGAATLGGADVLSLDIKPQGEYDANPTFASPVFTAPADPAAGDYTGTLLTTTAPAVALLDPNNVGGTTPNAVEPDSEPLMAQLSWGPVTAPATPPRRSDEWTINLRNVVGHPSDGVPTDATNGPTLAQVATAVEQAAAADTPAARNTAITAVNASAPIQPYAAYLEVLPRFFDFTQILDLSDRTDITHIDSALIAENARLQHGYSGTVAQNYGSNPLDLTTVNGGLDALDALSYTGCTYAFGGEVPSGTVATVEIFRLDFNSVDLAAIKAGGVTVGFSMVIQSPSYTELNIYLDPTEPSTSNDNGYLGVSDLTTTAQLVAAVVGCGFGLPSPYFAVTNNGDGSVTYTGYPDGNSLYEFTDSGDSSAGPTGITFTELQAAQFSTNSSVNSLIGQGNYVTTSV